MATVRIELALVLVACLQAIGSQCIAAANDAKRPNVVMIVTDNHGAWTLGCYGNPEIRTPNIDRLASEGMLFTRAFASNPVCSPTRATLLTGLVPSQHGVHCYLAAGGLQVGPQARCTLDEFTSLPEVLRDAGYDCGLVGKWHLGGNMHPQEGLDDYWITMPHGGTSTFYGADVIENATIRKEPGYLTDFWTDHAVQFIDRQASQDNPFFLLLTYNGPYALSRLLLEQGRNRHAEYYADKQLASFPRNKPHTWQLNNLDFINNPTSIRRVATEVSGVDDGVGEVMRALQTHGLDDNTIVVFVADQGWVGGHGGFFGMGDHTRPLTARDGMMQIPLIWRDPTRIPAGVRHDQMIANYDVMPTLLGQLGLGDQMPDTPQSPGVDFSKLLKGEALDSKPQDAIFYEFENLRCIRTSTHKYVHRHPNGPHELYDLEKDPDEFVNLVRDPQQTNLRIQLKSRLDRFYAEYALPKYDMWKGGTSQARIHDGIDEELAQLPGTQPPPLSEGFVVAPIQVPDGYSVELAAGPPLVTHPTMACFDDQGHLYVCNNAGVNLSNVELEEQLPNSIRRLVDTDQDGRFDSSTVFADKMTFPMGGVWHDGSLFVASPPSIWRLTDTDHDGVADERKVIVTQFGYTGNAASIHGCFFGPDGRLYWTDGYHGHEFKDDAGNITSKREGSYIFSCRPDGSDVQIHCGGGMDNPVEVDFTDSGDMLGTVNILYTRPREDCLVHWLHGGAYPHRERVLNELKVTGDLLGPVHRFGHVAVSGMTRYRSGTLDHRYRDDLFATFFNSGKVVRLSLEPTGSTYGVTQHEFLSSTSREFHPTDVLEDADGSLLVIDTGGWFYRGCPTSQFAKPELLGGIYRIRRDGMTPLVDPRGLRMDWAQLSIAELVRLLNDTRFAVRQRALDECVKRGKPAISPLKTAMASGDIRVRTNALWALSRLAQHDSTAQGATAALAVALNDRESEIRQAACQALTRSVAKVDNAIISKRLLDTNASVRRAAAMAIGVVGHKDSIEPLVAALQRDGIDRSEEHAIVYALIEIGDVEALQQIIEQISPISERARRGLLTAVDQLDESRLSYQHVLPSLQSDDPVTRRIAAQIAKKHPQWTVEIANLLRDWSRTNQLADHIETIETLLTTLIREDEIAALAGEWLQSDDNPEMTALVLQTTSRSGGSVPHPSWIAPLQSRLERSDDRDAPQLIAAVASLSGDAFTKQLNAIVADDQRSMPIRVNALAALAAHSKRLSDELFDRVLWCYKESASPTARQRAAQILGAANVSSRQLSRIAPFLTHASPTDLHQLIVAFQGNSDVRVIDEFLAAMESADSLLSVSDNEFAEVIKKFPPESLDRANRLLDRLRQHQQAKLDRLQLLRDQLDNGDATRGQQVFFSENAKCSSCHRIGEQGKRVGPDLTTIGANRSASDLLESIVFPSASIVRDYEAYQVLTVDGRVFTGVMAGESTDAIELQLATGERVVLRHDDIELISPSAISIMPAGMDESLSPTQLLDLVKYLQGLHP